jgi:hypothetical protein
MCRMIRILDLCDCLDHRNFVVVKSTLANVGTFASLKAKLISSLNANKFCSKPGESFRFHFVYGSVNQSIMIEICMKGMWMEEDFRLSLRKLNRVLHYMIAFL